MAQPANVFLTTGASAVVTMREFLRDVLSMISPEETPFFEWCDSGDTRNTTSHEWPTIALRPPAKNAQEEGRIITATAPKRAVRHINACQISDEVAMLSESTLAVDAAGGENTMEKQLLLKGIELRRDVEKGTLLANQVRKATDPRECAGIVTWAGSAIVGAGGTEPTGDGTTAYIAGTAYTLDKDTINDLLQEMWEKGARPSLAQTSPRGKRAFDDIPAGGDNLAENQWVLKDNEDIRVVVSASVYKSSFGTLMVVLNQWLGTKEFLVLDERPQFRPKVCTLPGLNFAETTPLINVAGEAKRIVFEGTLEVPNPDSVGLIAGFDIDLAS
jgi:hypothetical protein